MPRATHELNLAIRLGVGDVAGPTAHGFQDATTTEEDTETDAVAATVPDSRPQVLSDWRSSPQGIVGRYGWGPLMFVLRRRGSLMTHIPEEWGTNHRAATALR